MCLIPAQTAMKVGPTLAQCRYCCPDVGPKPQLTLLSGWDVQRCLHKWLWHQLTHLQCFTEFSTRHPGCDTGEQLGGGPGVGKISLISFIKDKIFVNDIVHTGWLVQRQHFQSSRWPSRRLWFGNSNALTMELRSSCTKFLK